MQKEQVTGPLTTDKVLVQRKFLTKRKQNLFSNAKNFEISRQQLNVKLNQEGIYECHGRIQVDYPVFRSIRSVLAEKLVEEAHLETIHRRVTLTMARISDQYRYQH